MGLNFDSIKLSRFKGECTQRHQKGDKKIIQQLSHFSWFFLVTAPPEPVPKTTTPPDLLIAAHALASNWLL